MMHQPTGRRSAIALLGAAAVTWPVGAQAKQLAAPVIGFLSSVSPGPFVHLVAAFRDGLGEAGYVEGRNVVIEYRWAEGRYDRLPALAADLVGRRVDVIVATGAAPAALAAKAATATIPIVFSGGGDPVKLGLVESLNRPGGNATGVYMFVVGMEPKRLELLRELVPAASLIAFLFNPTYPGAAGQLRELQDAARAVGQQVTILNASTEAEIDAAFAALVEQRAGALLLAADPFFNNRRDQITALAARHAVPAIYDLREFVIAGGLVSYGNSLRAHYRQMGVYAGRILGGARPADLPVVRPTRFELVVNLKAARALGIEIPPSILLRADEVIE
jgi:putative ABC transport system substrate-binding protein